MSKSAETKQPTEETENREKPLNESAMNILNQRPGMIVWAKIPRCGLWPCVIVEYKHLHCRKPKYAHQWVMWYGDYKISQRRIFTFPMGVQMMQSRIETSKDKSFCSAVLRAFKDYCIPSRDEIESFTLNYVMNTSNDHDENLRIEVARVNQPYEQDPYPQIIKNQLSKQMNREPDNDKREKLIMSNGEETLSLPNYSL
ncbi:hypothetical protein QAD02_000471 [Eretmocerus hayati]|uniref:Uncharacterized protein n=1 Tax=Eretmocerus hayati TaxID=131215 RepID=A0ACC2NDH4_9HYME|nr:hypothetical protein QAD02_000471 [Eretmocerus hayati]